MQKDNFDFYELKVGDKVNQAAELLEEGPYLAFSESGPIMYLLLSDITDREINSFHHNEGELRLKVINGIIFVTVRIANFLAWNDMTFSIELYKDVKLDYDFGLVFPPGKGMPFLFVLVDAKTKTNAGMRFISTSTEFANYFCRAVEDQMKKPFSKMLYDFEANKIASQFSSHKIAQMSEISYKFGDC